jgi:hypothetical protein
MIHLDPSRSAIYVIRSVVVQDGSSGKVACTLAVREKRGACITGAHRPNNMHRNRHRIDRHSFTPFIFRSFSVISLFAEYCTGITSLLTHSNPLQ